MIRIFSVLILLISNSFADIQIRKQNGLFCYDGDTCYVTYQGNNDKVRLLDLDTPEISHPKCEKEYTHGIEARNYINKYILDGEKIEFETEYNRDFFDRILAYIIVDGENVSKIMVLNGLGVVYDKNNKKDWCE
jgi:micrococcal nuclease